MTLFTADRPSHDHGSGRFSRLPRIIHVENDSVSVSSTRWSGLDRQGCPDWLYGLFVLRTIKCFNRLKVHTNKKTMFASTQTGLVLFERLLQQGHRVQ